MPLGRVVATSTDPNVRIRFSLTDTDDFYIDESTGDIFLINNYGLGSLPSSPETFHVFVNHNEDNEKSISVKVEKIAKDRVMVYETNSDEFSIESLNNLNDTVWFRVLNSQPKDSSSYARTNDGSLLFLTARSRDGNFLTRDEAADIAGGLDGININNNIEVDNHRTGPEDGGANVATIVLAVLLALVLLVGLAVLLFVKRGVLMDHLQRRRQPQDLNKDKKISSSEDKGGVGSEVNSRTGGGASTKARSQGMFNLQSTTIQMNSHENAKTQPPSHPAPHHQARSGLMREVSTELEKKLESRHKERPITVTTTSQVSARKGRAPATPSRPATTSTTMPTTNGVDKDKAGPGITFNPVAEVVEVEKRQRAVSVSSHGSTVSGSSISSSGSSAVDNDEETTRI